MTNTTPSALRHDIDAIALGTIIIVDGERFTRLGRWFDDTLPSQDFARVDGGYNASAGQLARTGFVVAN